MSPDHPTDPDLLAYVSGLLTGSPGDEIESHLAECTDCANRISTLPVHEDSFVAAVKDGGRSAHIEPRNADERREGEAPAEPEASAKTAPKPKRLPLSIIQGSSPSTKSANTTASTTSPWDSWKGTALQRRSLRVRYRLG